MATAASSDRSDDLADKRDHAADVRDHVADVRDELADKRDEVADQRDRTSEARELTLDVASLRGEQVSGPWGYRLAAVEQDSGEGIHAQIIDAGGREVAWAEGDTKPGLLRDASHKAHEHEATLDKPDATS